jgi:hypothetical protein
MTPAGAVDNPAQAECRWRPTLPQRNRGPLRYEHASMECWVKDDAPMGAKLKTILLMSETAF